MKHAMAILGAALLALTTTAQANTTHWFGPKMFVVLRSSDKPKRINLNENKLDEPKAIQCKSSLGCLISIQAQVLTPEDHGAYACALIDGIDAQPLCQSDENCCTAHTMLQNAEIAPGPHTIQTVLRVGDVGGTIANWAISYTIYEK